MSAHQKMAGKYHTSLFPLPLSLQYCTTLNLAQFSALCYLSLHRQECMQWKGTPITLRYSRLSLTLPHLTSTPARQWKVSSGATPTVCCKLSTLWASYPLRWSSVVMYCHINSYEHMCILREAVCVGWKVGVLAYVFFMCLKYVHGILSIIYT